ncbi:MAG: CAP domain-containing protein, partial [Acidimicrobiia bacterium]
EAGLEPLAADIGLIASARGHTAGMVELGELYHSTSGQLTSYASDWELLGENVGRGPSVETIHQAFMQSESHRANALGDFDRMGVGITRAEDGTLFATVVFMRRSPDAPADDGATGTMVLISGLPEFAVSRLLQAVAVFERSNRDLCSPLGSQGSACID